MPIKTYKGTQIKLNKKLHAKSKITLLMRPYSPISKYILQSFRFVLNHNLCIVSEIQKKYIRSYKWEKWNKMHQRNVRWTNLILCFFKWPQSSLVEFLEKAKVLACWTRDIVHNAVYAFFTIVTSHCWLNICQHLPIGFHHLFMPSQSIM